MLCEVDRSFIEDSFNLHGLRHLCINFQECIKIILDKTAAEQCKDPKVALNAFLLYGLIHARFIVTSRGLDAMLRKFRMSEFGKCPRILCQDQAVLPIGFSDEPRRASVKLYCPRCFEVYAPPASVNGEEPLDGAFFGTSFAHIFIMTFDKYLPHDIDNSYAYIPRIYGFKIHKSATCMQRRLASHNMHPTSNSHCNPSYLTQTSLQNMTSNMASTNISEETIQTTTSNVTSTSPTVEAITFENKTSNITSTGDMETSTACQEDIKTSTTVLDKATTQPSNSTRPVDYFNTSMNTISNDGRVWNNAVIPPNIIFSSNIIISDGTLDDVNISSDAINTSNVATSSHSTSHPVSTAFCNNNITVPNSTSSCIVTIPNSTSHPVLTPNSSTDNKSGTISSSTTSNEGKKECKNSNVEDTQVDRFKLSSWEVSREEIETNENASRSKRQRINP